MGLCAPVMVLDPDRRIDRFAVNAEALGRGFRQSVSGTASASRSAILSLIRQSHPDAQPVPLGPRLTMA